MSGGNSPQSNIELLAKKLSKASQTVRVVSFDVFGTLIHRTLPYPDASKTAAARTLQRVRAQDLKSRSVQELLAARVQAESSLRRAAKAAGCDPECRVDEVFRDWLQHYDIEPGEGPLQELLESEMEAERLVVYPTPGMDELINQLRSEGIRTVYVSDMYLRQSMIEELLNKCGYSNLFDAGYVSCELQKGKYSGKLFQHILDSEKIDNSELIHVGDDETSDIRGAKRASVKALQYRDVRLMRQLREQSCIESFSRKSEFWEGARWCNFAIAPPVHVERSEADIRYRIGYLQLGPLVCNFIHRVILRAQQEGLDLLLFPSREGHLLRAVYQRLASALSGEIQAPKSAYAHITRKSVYCASLEQFGEREVRAGFRTARPTIRGLCTRFSLPLGEVERCAVRAGIEDMDQTIVDPMNNSALQSVIADPDFLQIVDRIRSRRWQLLHDYLGQLGFWDCEAVGLVDVGWLGTVQEALDIAIGATQDRPVLVGFLMAVLGNEIVTPSPASSFEGVFHDHRASPGANFFGHFEEFFETCCRAPHPTVIDYERDEDGHVKPVFKPEDSIDYRLERENEPLIAAIQAGALDYCEDYARSLPFHDRAPDSHSDYILYKVDRLIRFPTESEANTLSQFYHCEDFGLSLIHVPDSSKTDETMREISGQPFPQHRLWAEGDRVRAATPGLNALYNVYRAVKSKAF